MQREPWTWAGVFKGHTDWVTCVCVTLDGKHIVSSSKDNTIRVWSFNSLADGKRKCVRTLQLKGHTSEVKFNFKCVCVSNDGRYIVSGSNDRAVRVWSFQSGECLAYMLGNNREIECVSISPDSKYVVSGSDDGYVCVWALWDDYEGASGVSGVSASGGTRTPTCTLRTTLVRMWASSPETLSFTQATLNDCSGLSNANAKLIEQLRTDGSLYCNTNDETPPSSSSQSSP